MNPLKSLVSMCVRKLHFFLRRTIAFTSTMMTAKWLNNDYSRTQFYGHVTLWVQTSTPDSQVCLHPSKPTFIPHSEIFGVYKPRAGHVKHENQGFPREGVE